MTAFLTSWLASVPTFAIPLLLASVGLILSERAGVLSLGAEGYMAMGAMTAAVLALSGAGFTLAALGGTLAGAALALVFGIAVVVFRADQILAGLAAVALGIGFTGVVGRPYLHKPFAGLPPVELGALAEIPLVGPLLFRQDGLAYVAVALTLAAWAFLWKSRTGLKLRAVGEDPATADVAGVDVQAVQLAAVLASGAFAGLAGATLSLAGSEVWVDGMVAGRGWIALALVIFARWDPARALLGALLFGGVEALLPRLMAVGVAVPVYLMSMLPYLLTIVVLVAAGAAKVRRLAEPAALARPYIRQDRR